MLDCKSANRGNCRAYCPKMASSRAPSAKSMCSSVRPTISLNMPKNNTFTRTIVIVTDGVRGAAFQRCAALMAAECRRLALLHFFRRQIFFAGGDAPAEAERVGDDAVAVAPELVR